MAGADGTHSRTRALTFGPEESFRTPLGLAHAWFTLTETSPTPPLDGWFMVHNAPGSRVVGARPGHPGTQEIGFSFAAATLPPRQDRDARQALVRETFAGLGWRTQELLDAMPNAADFALDTFDQIEVESWHSGRIVLLGDSSWCASPLSGLGTAFALQGAEILASELTAEAARSTVDWGDAFEQYEQAMRPSATKARKLLPGRVRSYAPRTAAGITAVATFMKAAQNPILDLLLTRIGSTRRH